MLTQTGFISHADLGIIEKYPNLLSLKLSFAITDKSVVGGSRSVNIQSENNSEFKEFCLEIYNFLKETGKYDLQEIVGQKVDLTFDGNGGIGSRLTGIKILKEE